MEEMGTGEKIARIIINQLQEDSGVEFAVTSRSIEFITNVIEQTQQQGLEQAAKYLESRADYWKIYNSRLADKAVEMYTNDATNVRRLFKEDNINAETSTHSYRPR